MTDKSPFQNNHNPGVERHQLAGETGEAATTYIHYSYLLSFV